MWVRPEKSCENCHNNNTYVHCVLSFLNCYDCCKKLFHPIKLALNPLVFEIKSYNLKFVGLLF